LAAGDFDGDGFTDLAIGDPEADGRTVYKSGRVRVIYGSRTGLDPRRSQVWSQDSAGVDGRGEDFDRLGSALVAANFGRGAQDDLAIGVPVEDGGRGAVTVVYGSRRGLAARGSQTWSQDSRRIAGRAEEEDEFGQSLAAGRFTGRRYADLVVGVPHETVGHIFRAGAVNIIRGSSKGLVSKGNQIWTRNSPGIRGKAASEDQLGSSLATGHYAGRPFGDLAIGAPSTFEEAGAENSGAVHVLYGTTRGLTAKGDQLWTQASQGIAGKAKPYDQFGIALAAANLGHNRGRRSYDDLAVGVTELEGTLYATGSVSIIYGSPKGLSSSHSQRFTQNTPGIAGVAGEWDYFGASLGASNFGKRTQPYAQLVVGVPGEGEYRQPPNGAINVINGSRAGLTSKGNRLWTAYDLQHPENVEIDFGWAMATGR
jgi:hypothetical protein